MSQRKEEIEIKNLNYLGIVAGIIDEIGIEEKINEIVGIDRREKVSAGQVVKAILLNNLGFVTEPLYLFSRFFQDKPLEHLLGEGLNIEELNDDKIGRVLDKLYSFSLRTIFSVIALEAAHTYEVNTGFSHLDSTSISVHGEYKQEESSDSREDKEGLNKDSEEENKLDPPIKITYGYSRDHRPDLKQFMIDLIVSSDGDVPLFFKTASGNEQDKAVFGQIISEYQKEIDFDSIMVCDSALYSQKNLEMLKNSKWLCRVPFTIKWAKKLAENLPSKQFHESEQEGYNFIEKRVNHSAVEQRWLLVESAARKKADLAKLEQKIEKEALKIQKALSSWNRRKTKSLSEKKIVVKQFNHTLKYHRIEKIKYPKSSNKAQETVYGVEGTISLNQEIIEAEQNRAGRFILATNVLEVQELSDEQMLSSYKDQQSGERGFRFLKDPLFFADSVFLKSPQRIETMASLMGLALLVYSLGQRYIRSQLKTRQSTVRNQLSKPTDKPTLRWIFRIFQGVHLLTIQGVKQIINLTEELLKILSFFPVACQEYYFFSSS